MCEVTATQTDLTESLQPVTNQRSLDERDHIPSILEQTRSLSNRPGPEQMKLSVFRRPIRQIKEVMKPILQFPCSCGGSGQAASGL
jgi:hypothetical protein